MQIHHRLWKRDRICRIIKKYATRLYSAQNRAVTTTDYESIIPIIYPETESVSVFGGEDLTPPQFGRVLLQSNQLQVHQYRIL